jgi:hypothetical protein
MTARAELVEVLRLGELAKKSRIRYYATEGEIKAAAHDDWFRAEAIYVSACANFCSTHGPALLAQLEGEE